MTVFKYKAVDRQGKTVNGTIKAPDRQTVVDTIKDMGYTPVVVEKGNAFNTDIDFGFLNSVNTKDLALYSRQFFILLDAGIAVLAALDILRKQTDNKKLKDITGTMLDDVQKGFSLNAAMRKHKETFPDIMLNIIEAGELSGNLDDSFSKIAIHFEKELELLAKLKGSMTYSLIMAVVALGVIIFMLVSVVPTFVSMFASVGTELPGSTKALLAMSKFITSYWYILLGIIILLVVGIKLFTRSDNGKAFLDDIKLQLPIFGPLNKKVIVARFARTLATLLSSGMPLLSSLEIVGRVLGNKKFELALDKVRKDVSNGVSLTHSLAGVGIFMKMVLQMVKVGEDTGRMENVLDKIADFYDAEIRETIEKLSTLLEPVMIMVLAGVVGFIVISIIEPMFKMLQTVK